MNYAKLLEDVKIYVVNIFLASDCRELPYHNLAHTEEVVANVNKICNHYKLNDVEYFIVVAAAWFHDVGYCLGTIEEHEQTGVEVAEVFFKTKEVGHEVVLSIVQCIKATRLPQKTASLLEEIICDGDLYHFGTDDFINRNKLLRKEMQWRTGNKLPKEVWLKTTIALLEAHQFKTGYCIDLLQETKNKNLLQLKQKVANRISHSSIPVIKKSDPLRTALPIPLLQNGVKQNGVKPERAIETMFKITSGANQRLSEMADNKANIMITTTSIIISVLLSVLIRKLEENPNLAIPTLLLLVVCVTTMVLSILATRPMLSSGISGREDMLNKKANLLFFGNFYKMPLEDYTAGIQHIMQHQEYLYGSLTRDTHAQGVVLGRKYHLLRIGYNIFMYGIVLSVISFVMAVLLT